MNATTHRKQHVQLPLSARVAGRLPTELDHDHPASGQRAQLMNAIPRSFPFLLALLAPVASVHADATIGRLFFTPEQRAALDNARRQNVSSEAENATTPDNITLNGVVKRSDGRHTVWINNRAFGDKSANDGVSVTRDGKTGGFNVQLPYSEKRVQLKVGQSLDSASGKVEEAYYNKAPSASPKAENKPQSDIQPETSATTKSSSPSSSSNSFPAKGKSAGPDEAIGHIN